MVNVRCALYLLLGLVVIVPNAAFPATPSPSPEAIVQAQIEAYNARDIDVFLATYAEDAQLFEHPAKLLANGSVQIML